MKYDILNSLRRHLHENYKKNTAERYFFAVDKLFKNIQFSGVQEIQEGYIETEIIKIKNKNDFSATKNGLKNLKEVFPEFILPSEDFFTSTSRRKRNWSKRPKNTIYLQTTMKKINALQNKKLKYAYRLALVSGLRVSELAALTKNDIAITSDGKITVNVLHGKGGSNGLVSCMEDKYLAVALGEYMKDKEGDEKLFYESITMKKEAWKLGLECHNFRRIAAITYRQSIVKEVGKKEADTATKNMLRHTRFSVTKRYLRNRKLEFRSSKEE